MATLVSLGSGLIGTLVGAVIAWLVGRRQHRVETTFAMHQEFHSAEMTKSRGAAGKTVREHYPKNYDELRRTLEPEVAQHVWNVMYFYQRLWLAIKYNNIHTKYVPELFGENFWWWYLKSYEVQLVKLEEEGKENWQAARHIEELWIWMGGKADTSDVEHWRERAKKMADPT